MALIQCTECDKQISNKAKSCPHCGFPLSSRVIEWNIRDDKNKQKSKFLDSSSNVPTQERQVIKRKKKNYGFAIFLLIIITIIFLIAIDSSNVKNTFNETNIESNTNNKSNTVRYTTSYLNVRSKPNSESEILEKIAKNEKVITSGAINNGYIEILNTDKTERGWVAAKYLNNFPQPQEQTNPIKENQTKNDDKLKTSKTNGLITTTKYRASVKPTPTISTYNQSEEITELNKGQKIEILSYARDYYYKVRTDEHEGYLHEFDFYLTPEIRSLRKQAAEGNTKLEITKNDQVSSVDVTNSLAFKLALLDKNGNIKENDILIKRFDYLLMSLDNKYIDSKTQIADKTTAAWQQLRARGVNANLLEIMEGMNSLRDPSRNKMRYHEYLTIYVILRKEMVNHQNTIKDFQSSINLVGIDFLLQEAGL